MWGVRNSKQNESQGSMRLLVIHFPLYCSTVKYTVSSLLSLSEIENNAAELVEANRVVGALGDLAQVVLNLGISVLDAEVVEALVKLLHLVELEHAVAVDVKGVKQLANLGLRHGKSADVAHVLCVDTTA
eukprot:TRINITY_DN2044_c0_g1_i3.p1 TRINITY_DN2044_c0_g1~~TRINITY_DN2044_c0_g1_i3.p1  ORF type:complete len:130 (-),score=8.94 TRINITY_DN2044_c0_g1_i3:5-394(-)